MAENSASTSTSGAKNAGSKAETGPTLDELLAQWDNPSEEKKAKPKSSESSDGTTEIDALRDKVTKLEQSAADSSYRTAMSSAVSVVKGDLDVDSFLVEGWLEHKATQEPRLADAWTNRETNPGQFKKLLGKLGQEFQEYWELKTSGKRDPNQGAQDAITAALRASANASLPEGPEVNLSSLNDMEFALKKAEILKQYKDWTPFKGTERAA